MAEKEEKALYTKDGIVYIKLDDGRVWCPSGQSRGIKYNIKEDDFPKEFNLSRDFIAIDFETVVQNKVHYPCQLGLVVVRNCKVVEEHCFLIQPPGNLYDSKTQKVHHISPNMTINEPEFPVIWNEIKDYFDDCFLVAHNLRFDGQVLYNVLEKYGLERKPIHKYACTMIMNKRRGLEETCEMYDITLNNHHDGLADARACAEIFIAMNNGIKPKNIARKQKQRKKEIVQMSLYDQMFEGHNVLRGDILKKDLTDADPNNPFYDRKVVITGIFDIDRTTIAKRLKSMGADINNSISKNTNFILIGADPGQSKLEKVKQLEYNGYNIKKIYQQDLQRIFDGDYDDYFAEKTAKKDLNISYDFIESDAHHLQLDNNTATNILSGTEIFCGVSNERKYIFAQMLGNNGAFCNFKLDTDIKVCILSNETVTKLKEGDKDSTIMYIQDTYNSMKTKFFDFKFTTESEILEWIRRRAEQFNDDVTMSLYNQYIKQ